MIKSRAVGASTNIADLYRSHGDRLRRTAYLATGSREVAEDLVQEAFLRVQQRWDHLDEPAAYLRVVVVNLCLSWQNRAGVERRQLASSAPAPVDEPAIDETWDLLAHLPRDQRVVLVLRYYDDLTTDEIGRVLDVNPATVRTRLHRALSRLRRELSK